MDKEYLKELIHLINETDITHFSLNNDEFEVKIEKGHSKSVILNESVFPQTALPQEQIPSGVAPQPAKPSEAQMPEDDYHYVRAPLVGTFYQASSPDAQPYVKVGDRVEKGDTVCIIEAMKLLNEIKSDISGRVVSIEAANAAPVEFGSKLIGISPE